MINLTEYNWYYCKMRDGDIQMLERGDGFFLSGDVPLLDNEVEQVLAPVPSYEEWFNQGDYIAFLEEENKNLKEELQNQAFILKSRESEITKLKKLLKDCRGSVATIINRSICEINGVNQKKLLTEIDQALANNKIQANTVACNKIQENK